MPNPTILDLKDDLSRYTLQAKALVQFLVIHESANNTLEVDLGDILWLLSDRIADIEITQQKLIQEMKAKS